MEWLRSKSLVNALLFPAPEPSYRWCDFPGSLVWIPHDARDPGAVSPPAPLAGFYVQNPRGATHVLLYLHGNGEDLGHIRDHLVDYARQWRVHVLAVEYPGYGANSRHGPPANEDTVVGAARSALRFIGAALGVPPARTILFGRSIGTGPATLLAAELAEAEGAGAMVQCRFGGGLHLGGGLVCDLF
jgi:pimeloyl-ACP methyl ester carboxylesterase